DDRAAERPQDDTPRPRGADDLLADARRGRVGRAGRALLNQLDPDHDALLPDVTHVGERRDVGAEPLPETRDLRREALESALFFEQPETCKPDRAGERVPGVGVAVEEGAQLLVRREERP